MLGNHNDNDNQHPSNNSNIIKGSTTNSRDVIDNANVSNANTSAAPDNIGEDIVWTTHICHFNNKSVEYKDKEPYR